MILWLGLSNPPAETFAKGFRLGLNLRDGGKLVSAFGKYSLKFFSPNNTEKRYVGIFYMDEEVVWVANRNTPILDESGWLTVDGDGNLKIFHGGSNSIAITSYQPSCCIVVTLHQTGNLVLRKMDSNGTTIKVMWQSFDCPSDTLLPGMKLGINLQTGHKWFLQSWISEKSPAQGSFSLGLDRNFTNQLVLWWRGEVYQTSKLWLNDPFNSSNSWTRGNYEFSFTSNEKEIYFSYSLISEQSFKLLKILPDGRLSIPELGFGMPQKVPTCRRDVLYFQSKYGFMSREGFKFKESENMSHADCELKCWFNCSCFAYATTDFDTSCEIWGRGPIFTEAKWDDINSRNEVMEMVDYCSRSSTSNPAVFLVLWRMEKVQGERGEVVAAISCCSRSSIIGPAVVLLMLFDTEKTEGKR
ncbi:hypothetical protein Pint_29838 [Pistacia integerrima]|uniref:Uncharacterized protein n=1 Tax=Pistacia integerrima TaxID=434235 RepID=A0ACC0X284_9ROSI|nr:hypothetical protein Pint_29838 [Pistacia integerrima]